MLCFIPRDVLDKILDLIESASEGYPTYSYAILPLTHLMTEVKVIDFVNGLLKCLL